jgi:glycosyltransferase involved in cell wall biosynthesis
MTRPRVAYLSLHDPLDHASYRWSGTNYFLYRALERALGSVFHVPLARRYDARFGFARLRERWCRRVGLPSGLVYTNSAYSSFLMDQVRDRLRGERHDVVFSIAAPLLRGWSGAPALYYSDATFAGLVDYLPAYRGLTARARRDGHALERDVVDRAAASIYTSRWATDSAVRDHGAAPEKVHLIPLGANLDVELIPTAAEACAARRERECRLLLVGVEWERKGCDKALAVRRLLERAGVPARLTIVGCRPPRPIAEPGVRLVANIDKFAPGGMESLARLYRDADYFLLPTVAECSGVVFSEASAFGVPSVTHATGGVATSVRDGVNGWTLDPASPPERMAEAIAANFADDRARLALRASTKDLYETTLAWRHAGARVRELVLAAMDAPSTAAARA